MILLGSQRLRSALEEPRVCLGCNIYICGNLKTRMDQRDSARRRSPCDSNSSSTYHPQSSETREAGRLEDSYGPHTCYLVVVAGCCWP